MNKALTLVSSILLTCNFSYGYASGQDCELVDVNATLQTIIVSPRLQLGTIDLTVISADEINNSVALFEQSGGLIGRIIFSDTEAGFSLLNHKIVFEKGSSLHTENDQAQVVGLCDDGRLHVIESIKTIAWGNKFFKRAYLAEGDELVADGCLDPSLGGTSNFSMTGQICLK